MTNEYRPSSSDRVRDQVARYEATDGVEGGELNGLPVVILTTRGAVSGAVRKTPIMRVIDRTAYVAIASYAGSPLNPAWCHNLLASPEAEIRDRNRIVAVCAREVHGADKDRLWAIADAGNTVYADYRARAGRDIPILVLDRIGMRDRGNADSHHRQEFGL